MKVIITEDKLYDAIYKFIDKYYDKDDIHYDYNHDEDGNPTDNAIMYYVGDWDIEGGDIFRLYSEEYWEGDSPHANLRRESSPILMIYDEDFSDRLNGLFGDKWKPVLKDWFETNFDYKVKTIDHY
jgi:hypothetical protein